MNTLQKNMLNINHLDKLDAFDIQPDEYIILASAACILYGMDITNEDLDVCMSDAAIRRNKKLLVPGEKVVFMTICLRMYQVFWISPVEMLRGGVTSRHSNR